MRHSPLAIRAVCATVLAIQMAVSRAAPVEGPIYQLRVYGLVDEHKDAFHARFRDHALPIMKRHGFDVISIWETRESRRFLPIRNG